VNGQPIVVPNSLLILLAVMLIWKYVKNAKLGNSIYAAGGNPFSAYASGLSVEKAKIAAYVGSALLASVAGIVVCGKTMTGDATIGNPYTLSSIAGTVLGGASFMGGVGTMKGAVAGALILGLLVNILFFLGLSSHYQNIAEGIILLAAVIISVLTNREGSD
jgi:ribose transport system permease protein